MINQTHILDIVPGGVTPVVHVKQYQTDEKIYFKLVARTGEFNISANYTSCVVRGTKSDGNGYSASAGLSLSSQTVTVQLTEQMTAVAGEQPFEIVITDSIGRMITATYILDVEQAALDGNTIASDSVIEEISEFLANHPEYIEEALTRLVVIDDDTVRDTVQQWLDDHPEATTTVGDGSISKEKLSDAVVEYIDSIVDDKVYTVSDTTLYAEKMKNAGFSYTDFRRTTKSFFTGNSSDVYRWLQSTCYVDYLDHVILGFCKPPDEGSDEIKVGILVEYDMDSNTVITRSEELPLGHMNDIAYNPHTGMLYVATMDSGTYANMIVIVDPDTLEIDDSIDIDNSISQLSYDDRNKIYYAVGSDFTLLILDLEFAVIDSVSLQAPEDIGIYAHNGDPLTAQGSICINGDFWVIYQDVDDAYFFSYDIETGNIYRYQKFTNMSYNEEVEGVALIGHILYSFGAYYDNIFIRAYDIGTSSSTQETLQNSGFKLEEEADLNTITAPGKYFSPSAIETAEMSNIPTGLASGFSMYVLNQGKDWLVQVIIENSTRKKIYFRTMNAGPNAGTFGAWVRNGDAFSYGDEIPDNTNLNSVTLEGKYYSANGTRTATMSNVPSECGSGFSLYVLDQGYNWLVQIMVENSARKKIYFRTRDASSVWGVWRLKNKETVSSTAISENGTFTIPQEYMDYDYITISCNRNYYFGSVTVPTKAISQGDVANGTVCISDMTHYWKITISSSRVITVTGLNNVSAPYIRLIAS